MSESRKIKSDDVISDNEDSDDDKAVRWNHEDVKKCLHNERQKAYPDDYPPRASMKHLANTLMKGVAKMNNSSDILASDSKHCDTIAIGMSEKGTERNLIIAANLKERHEVPGSNTGDCMKTRPIKRVKKNTVHGREEVKVERGPEMNVQYREFGCSAAVCEKIAAVIAAHPIYKNSRLGFTVIGDKQNPQLQTMKEKAYAHAEKHAESQIIAFAEKTDSTVTDMAISKPPCAGCFNELNENGVKMVPEKRGTSKVTHRRAVNKDEVEVRKKVVRSKQIQHGLSYESNNVHLSTKVLKETVIRNAKRSVKPGASVGILSGIYELYDSVANKGFTPFAGREVVNADAGVVANGFLGQRCYARASVAEARAGVGNLVAIGVSALSAGAHAEFTFGKLPSNVDSTLSGKYNLGDLANIGASLLSNLGHISVGANASLVRLDGNLGPIQAGIGLNVDTHASIGANGISASVLGVGFSIGARWALQTPFFDVSVALF